MDSSFFNSEMQSVMFQLVSQMMTRLAPAAQSPQERWIYAGQTGNTTTSLSAAAGSVTSAGSFEELIQQAAARYQVDPDLIKAVIKAESNFNPTAVSSAGASGLMQLMPATARSLGVSDSFDPLQNINGGAKLLSQLLARYNQNVSFALAAYNAGPGAVDRYGGIPPYAETQVYVPRVLQYLAQYEAQEG